MNNTTVAFALLLTVSTTASVSYAAKPVSGTIPEDVTPQRVLAGSEIFNNGPCVHCHAIAGRGTGRFAPNLSDAEWLHSTGDYKGILHTIFWGVERTEFKAITPRKFEMNPKGNLNLDREQLRAIAAYVWSLSRPQTNKFVAAQARFVDLVHIGELDKAVALFHEWAKTMPKHLLLPENALNLFGYQFMQSQPDVAMQLFKLNAQLHPASWNVYDSLGEAYMNMGNKDEAIRNYRKSLSLNPKNDNATKKLKKLNTH